MNNLTLLLILSILSCNGLPALVKQRDTWKIVYEQDFEKIEEGGLPEDFFLLEGDFSVRTINGQKLLSMLGNPVGEHGFLFGPRLGNETIQLSFSCLGGLKSRRHNVFSGAMGGIRGINYRVNPISSNVTVSFMDSKVVRPIYWSSNNWVNIKITVIPKVADGESLLIIRSSSKSQDNFYSEETKMSLNGMIKGGKCALWGFAYAEKEMYWDDLLIRVQTSD
jgi:hypothetical protein